MIKQVPKSKATEIPTSQNTLSKNKCMVCRINLSPATMASKTWPTAEGWQEQQGQSLHAATHTAVSALTIVHTQHLKKNIH